MDKDTFEALELITGFTKRTGWQASDEISPKLAAAVIKVEAWMQEVEKEIE